VKQFTLTAAELEIVEPVEVRPFVAPPIVKQIPGPPGPKGERGEKGESIVGPAGPPGKDAVIDRTELNAYIARVVADAQAKVPPPKDGKDGKQGARGEKGDTVIGPPGEPGRPGRDGRDADPKFIEKLVANAVAGLPAAKDGEDGAQGDDGANGWTPVLELEGVAGAEYLRVSDWLGGEGEKPAIGYVTRNGIVDDVRVAIDLKGTAGVRGPRGFDGAGGGGSKGEKGDKGDKGDKGEDGTGTGGEPPISGSDGDDVIGTASGNLSGHRVVRSTGTDDLVDYADSTNPAHAGTVIGITLNAANNGTIVLIRATGEVSDPSFTFAPGPIYFDALGRLTQVLPTSGFMQQVAVASSLTEIVVQLGPPIILS
jgi:hypothetical protein